MPNVKDLKKDAIIEIARKIVYRYAVLGDIGPLIHPLRERLHDLDYEDKGDALANKGEKV